MEGDPHRDALSTTGLTTSGLPTVTTRSWAFWSKPTTGNEKSPALFVISGLPIVLKPPRYGNGLACNTSSWLAAPVPDNVPSTVRTAKQNPGDMH